jgi:hypothetical protein
MAAASLFKGLELGRERECAFARTFVHAHVMKIN